MIYLTKAQRKGLYLVWLRHESAERKAIWLWKIRLWLPDSGISYREFRRKVTGLIGGDGCVMVEAGGMWFGIETDGHYHT